MKRKLFFFKIKTLSDKFKHPKIPQFTSAPKYAWYKEKNIEYGFKKPGFESQFQHQTSWVNREIHFHSLVPWCGSHGSPLRSVPAAGAWLADASALLHPHRSCPLDPPSQIPRGSSNPVAWHGRRAVLDVFESSSVGNFGLRIPPSPSLAVSFLELRCSPRLSWLDPPFSPPHPHRAQICFGSDGSSCQLLFFLSIHHWHV